MIVRTVAGGLLLAACLVFVPACTANVDEPNVPVNQTGKKVEDCRTECDDTKTTCVAKCNDDSCKATCTTTSDECKTKCEKDG